MGKHGDNTVGPDSDDGHASPATNPTREQPTRQDSKHDRVGESSMTPKRSVGHSKPIPCGIEIGQERRSHAHHPQFLTEVTGGGKSRTNQCVRKRRGHGDPNPFRPLATSHCGL
jgi:hypothetical protein